MTAEAKETCTQMDDLNIVTMVNAAIKEAGFGVVAKLAYRTSVKTSIKYAELTFDSDGLKTIRSIRKIVSEALLTACADKTIYRMCTMVGAKRYYIWNLYYQNCGYQSHWKSYRAGMTWKA